MTVTVRYFAGARAAAGRDAEDWDPVGGDPTVTDPTVADLVAWLGRRHGERLARVLGACSFLVDGVVTRDPARPLRPGTTVDVLPPFAGG